MDHPDLRRSLRAYAGEISLTYNVWRRWSKPVPPPALPDPLPQVRLYCVIAAWCEADVITSTVQNAFAQGCERVFLIDNASPDDTVAEATSVGAEVASIYRTDYYDELRRLAEVSKVIEGTSAKAGTDHVWWLTCDADELPHGPDGLTIREYLSTLDRRFRVVGARVFNHFPSGEPAHRPGYHPIDYQPLCQEVRIAWCKQWHWKHPLLRWDRGGPPLLPDLGFHRLAHTKGRLLEPAKGIFMHHFQYRGREATLGRLSLLCNPDANGHGRMDPNSSRPASEGIPPPLYRLRAIEAVYEGRWAEVPRPGAHHPKLGVQPRPWAELVSPADATFKRWYPHQPQPQPMTQTVASSV